MPMSMYSKIKRHLENNQKSTTSFEEQDKLLGELPQALRNQIIQCTHGEIVERIDFMKGKDSEFLILIIPELKPLKLLEGDILYQQKDYADEIYLIKGGSVKLNVDISDFILNLATEGPELARLGSSISNRTGAHEDEEEDEALKKGLDLSFPFIKYIEGSYFGDVDTLVPGSKFFERDSTAVASSEVNLFVLSRDIIVNILKSKHEEAVKDME